MTAVTPYIEIGIDQQLLRLFDQSKSFIEYPVATAKNGAGQEYGSECTPLGRHYVRAKIGAGHRVNTVFVGRRPTGEEYCEAMGQQQPQRDWILSRILWLCGDEPGKNRLGSVDTMRRFIYIHGAPDSHRMQIPSSHGCVKMRNNDVIDLFDRVPIGIPVTIKQSL